MGKPAPVIYAAALEMLQLPPTDVVAVGDSLAHDIAGAAAAGIDSVFVAGGIHAAECLPGGGGVDARALAALCEQHGPRGAPLRPTYAIATFSLA